MAKLPEDFLSYFYYGIRDDYSEIIENTDKPLTEIFLGLTRNNPVIVTCDNNLNPNGAVKSVSYILKEEYLKETIKPYDSFLNLRWEKIRKKMGKDYESDGWIHLIRNF